jgi:hypothetical protein
LPIAASLAVAIAAATGTGFATVAGNFFSAARASVAASPTKTGGDHKPAFGACFLCDSPTHWAPNCPNRKTASSPSAATTNMATANTPAPAHAPKEAAAPRLPAFLAQDAFMQMAPGVTSYAAAATNIATAAHFPEVHALRISSIDFEELITKLGNQHGIHKL